MNYEWDLSEKGWKEKKREKYSGQMCSKGNRTSMIIIWACIMALRWTWLWAYYMSEHNKWLWGNCSDDSLRKGHKNSILMMMMMMMIDKRQNYKFSSIFFFFFFFVLNEFYLDACVFLLSFRELSREFVDIVESLRANESTPERAIDNCFSATLKWLWWI